MKSDPNNVVRLFDGMEFRKSDLDEWVRNRHLLKPGSPERAAADAYIEAQKTLILSGAEFMARHVPPDWLVESIVQRGRLYACTSKTSHGKTAVWLFNACMIQTGRMIGSLDVLQGNVLYLAGENPADLEARMIGMATEFNIPAAKMPYVLPRSFPLDEPAAEELCEQIKAMGIPFALIIGDTAASFFPGDKEDDNVQAGTYARTLRTFTTLPGSPAVVVLCHPIKHAGKDDLLPRGGGAFLNELDGNLTLWSEAQGEVTQLHWQGKIRGPDFPAFSYRLRSCETGLVDKKGRKEVTIVAEPMSDEAVADHSKQSAASEDRVLRELADTPGISMNQIARNAGWVDDGDRPSKARVQRAIQRLAADKLVVKERHIWAVTPKGKTVLENLLRPRH